MHSSIDGLAYSIVSVTMFENYVLLSILWQLTQQKIKLIMNTPDKSHKHRLPDWQSEKMRTLIEERWSEVWEIVVARERSTKDLLQHSRSSANN